VLRIRSFRPFPTEAVREALRGVKAVAVMDRALSFGGPAGPLMMDMAAVFYGLKEGPVMLNYIYGLGGRDISTDDFKAIVRDTLKAAEEGVEGVPVKFVGVRG